MTDKQRIPKRPRQRPLTPKQMRFVAEYLNDLNGAAAVTRAGYRHKRPDQMAYELLRKHEISAAVSNGKATQLAAANVSAVRVVEEERRIGLNDPRSLFDAHGNQKPITEWTAEQAACLASFEIIRKKATAGDGHIDTIYKLKFWNKIDALQMLAKRLGIDKPEEGDDGRDVPSIVFPPGTRIAIE
jgi:phage terminase small subunit